MTTGEKIKRIRLHRKMTQKELGDAVGLTANRIAQYEMGYRVPKAALLEKMAEAMNRSPTTTRKRMEELIKGGYIRFNGRGGHGSWEVCKELPDNRNLHNNSG